MIEAAALLDLLLGNPEGEAVGAALAGREVHLADPVGVVVAGALGRLAAEGTLSAGQLGSRIRLLESAPFTTHSALTLIGGAVQRGELSLGDALSVELSDQLDAPLLTTEVRLAAVWPRSWLVTSPVRDQPGR